MDLPQKTYGHPGDSVMQDIVVTPTQYDGSSPNRVAESLNRSRPDEKWSEKSELSSYQLYQLSLRNARLGESPNNKVIVCGPLLNYRYMDNDRWYGSVLVVSKQDGDLPRLGPTLLLRQSVLKGDDGHHSSPAESHTLINGYLLYGDSRVNFWRFDIDLKMESTDTKWEYMVTGGSFLHRDRGLPSSFIVPSYNESMRVMFYSCNGWCDGAEEGDFNHLSLWKDVLRKQAKTGYHVMIGGGDQIYSDEIYTAGPLVEWTDITDPQERLQYQCTEQLQQECDDWYLDNYIRWYSTKPFAYALSQIPSLNIWDDHDIIDGFGSYAKETMECSVFQAIGALAHKYYLLFQHHLPPSKPELIFHDAYKADSIPDPHYRTQKQTNYRETYDLLFERVNTELDAAKRSDRPIKHLVLLFGVPLAYPQLTWTENVFEGTVGRSFQRLSEKLNIGKNAVNKFDGSIELLDDLNDHYTSHAHQNERRYLIERIQSMCAAHSVRATILSGDVHLAAVGRFFTSHGGHKPDIEEDFRFINNIISSAIVNAPPPEAMAKLIAQSDKLRLLNPDTEEVLFQLFRPDPTNKRPEGTTVAIPRRNYSIITENSPNNEGRYEGISKLSLRQFFARRGRRPLHFGEANAGKKHQAASEEHGKGNDGSLDVCICVEVDHQYRDGQTEAYGFSIPALKYHGPAIPEPIWPEKTV
ncbi:hypothetical protein ETB97_002082 [Aspergillus alliaceus]|uniref:PhoD-like phosphatase domain-containing protein n=1 Tax=Petromyces alliaceus TaxID=209559 RepID=A0A8H6E5C4_PETAA|nr:hypothetical protein ETB97_002082 [Aspergillus burnettii]